MARRPCTFKKALLAANRDRPISAVADLDQVNAIRRGSVPTLAPAKAVLDKLTRQTARNIEYLGDPDVADEVMAAIGGHRVMIWGEVQKGESIPIRNIATRFEKGKPIKSSYSIQNQDEYAQRLRKQKPREVLYEIADHQNRTRELVVDLDPQPAFGFEKSKEAAVSLFRELNSWQRANGVRVYYSGSKGWHLHVDLKNEIDITKGREALTKRLKPTMDKSKGVWTHSTQKKTEDQLLVDVLVNKPRGVIRTPFTPHQNTGRIKVSIADEVELRAFKFSDATIAKARETILAGQTPLVSQGVRRVGVEAQSLADGVGRPDPTVVQLVDTAKPQNIREAFFASKLLAGKFRLNYPRLRPLFADPKLDRLVRDMSVMEFAVDQQLSPGVHYLHGGNFDARRWLEKTVGIIDPKNPPAELAETLADRIRALEGILEKRSG